jgi:hypothetical protein
MWQFGHFPPMPAARKGFSPIFAGVFTRLRNKWGVSGIRFILIFCTFAMGGSLCGWAARKLLGLTSIDGALWLLLYFLLVSLLWPLAVLVVSIPMGQFPFFRDYLRRMGQRMVRKKR